MMGVFYGALGALMTLALVALGAVAGWKARGAVEMRHAVQEDSEEGRRRILEEQQAFEDMLHYNMDTAYGLHTVFDGFPGGDGQ